MAFFFLVVSSIFNSQAELAAFRLRFIDFVFRSFAAKSRLGSVAVAPPRSDLEAILSQSLRRRYAFHFCCGTRSSIF